MEIKSLLSLCKDIAHFFFSILQLLLTRILPLLALLVGSLLLHLFHFMISLLFRRPVLTMRALFRKKRSMPHPRRSESAGSRRERETAVHGASDGAQDEAMYSDEDGAYVDLQEESVESDEDAVALQEESVESDEDAVALQELECYEDCLVDEDFNIEGQRLLLKQYEEMKLGARTTARANGEMREADTVEQTLASNPQLDSPQQAMEGHLPERGNSSRQSGEGGTHSVGEVGNSREEVLVGDFRTEAGDPAGLESHGRLFPSDLPATLDPIVNAAAAAENDAVRSGRTASMTRRRALPPTLSNIQQALQDIRAQQTRIDAAPSFSHAQPAAVVPANPPARTASFDNFVRKFSQHFKLDGH